MEDMEVMAVTEGAGVEMTGDTEDLLLLGETMEDITGIEEGTTEDLEAGL